MEHFLLETKNLCKVFKGQPAVRQAAIQVPQNCVYGLLGANGAGKSTTLKMLCGMLRPTAGEILFEGESWNRSALRHIGVLIESPPLYENLTAGENLRVRTQVLGLPKERIGQVLEAVELTNTGKKRAGQFSMGMKQRLGIAIALLHHPKLLILDEPTNGLDPFGIQELRRLITSFPRQGITVILSSHILSEVSQMADYIGILSNGALAYQEPLEKGDDLERVFMEVSRQTGREVQ